MSREPCRHGHERYCELCSKDNQIKRLSKAESDLTLANDIILNFQKEISRLKKIEEMSLSKDEAVAIIEKLNGRGEVNLDYIHAHIKLKTTAGWKDAQ